MMRKLTYLSIALAIILLFSCKKEVQQNVEYSNIIYEVSDVAVYSSALEKTKQKTPEQYISILYQHLLGTSISTGELSDLSLLSQANGDKTLANELIISQILNSGQAQIPTNQTMRNNVEQFVEATYLKFYLRNPTPYEKEFLVQLINDDANLTPEIIYTSFALSNEYYFY